jgi:hypothetical protein
LACIAYVELIGQARHLDASVEPMTEEKAEDFVRSIENEFNQIEGRW